MQPERRSATGRSTVRRDAAQPLSKTRLWQVNEDYFSEMGVRAWSSGEVPFDLTTGPVMARAYSRLVTAFLEDCVAGRAGAFDPSDPVYIIELAAGTGRLGFEFLNAFDAERFAPIRVVYVLTDLMDSNITFFSNHEKLEPFYRDGRADFARYEIGGDTSLHLVRSDVDLFASPPANPIICIANYAFSDLPQDLYSVIDSVLHQELVELTQLEMGDDPTPERFFSSLFMATERVPASSAEVGDGMVGRALSAFAAAKGGADCRFLFPVTVLRSIEALLHLSCERLLLLASDRGDLLPAGATDRAAMDAYIAAMPVVPEGFDPTITVDGEEKHWLHAMLRMGIHGGCFSLPFDMSIVACALEPYGFSMLPVDSSFSGIQLSVVANESKTGLVHLRQAYSDAVGDLSPENLFLTMQAAVHGNKRGLDLMQLLAMLRVSGYDSAVLRECRLEFEPALQSAPPVLVDEAVHVFDKVFDHHFPLIEGDDLAWDIAILLGVAGRFDAALAYYGRSLAETGSTPEKLWRIAECHFLSGESALALQWADRSLELQPDYQQAQLLRSKILGEGKDAING